jgi:Protein of unknown function (DUF1616)
MTRIPRSPVLLAATAIVAGAVAVSPAPDVIRAAFAIPLTLYLPGYAIVEALWPRTPSLAERLALAVALSIAVCIVGGFALNWSPVGLTMESWAVLLVSVSVAAAAAWSLRRQRKAGGETSSRRRGVRPSTSSVANVVTGVIFAGAAIGLARTPLPAQGVPGYTMLSLVPAVGASDSVRVAVTSAELRKTPYRLELRAGGQLALERQLTLAPGGHWESVIDVASVPRSRRSVEALLYRASDRRHPYRHTTLVLPGSRLPARTMIWLLWVDEERVRLGMTSAELRPTGFRFELFAGRRLEGRRLERVARVRIAPGEQWNAIIDVSSIPVRRRSFLTAVLYRQGEYGPEHAYRRVTLVPPGGGLLTASGNEPEGRP